MKSSTAEAMLKLTLLLLMSSLSMGLMPDASEEALVRQRTTEANMALLHFVVPPNVIRATFEFASFQEHPDCESRAVHVLLRHAAFPSLSNSSEMLMRTTTTRLVTDSKFRPQDALVHAIYNPRPGSYFALAYLDHYDQKHGLSLKCRYSIGSIGLWSRLEEPVILLEANKWQKVRSKSVYTYFKFRVPNAIIPRLKVDFNRCHKVHKIKKQLNEDESDGAVCLEHVSIRAAALPFRDVMESARRRVFDQERVRVEIEEPELDTIYYGMIVSSAQVEVEVRVQIHLCDDRREDIWDEHISGLKLNNQIENDSDDLNKVESIGFRLFSIRSDNDNYYNYSYSSDNFEEDNSDVDEGNKVFCNGRPTHVLGLERLVQVSPLTVDFKLLRGSWYSNWITLSSSFITVVQLKVADPEDLGAVFSVVVRLDDHSESSNEEVRVVLIKNRLVFDDSSEWTNSAVLKNGLQEEHKFSIEYPEPGLWHLGLDLKCNSNDSLSKCSTMVEIKSDLRPCGLNDGDAEMKGQCQECVLSTKQTGSGAFTLASCLTSSDGNHQDRQINKWLLVLSNVAFLPVAVLAFYLGLYTQSLMSLSILISSSLYHFCDQDHQSLLSPLSSSSSFCHRWYMEKEVLQFADFYSATLAFWTTAVALCHLNDSAIISALNTLGAIMLALIVHVDRDPLVILLIPVPAGLVLVALSLVVRCLRHSKSPSMSLLKLWPYLVCGLLLVSIALGLVLVVESDDNYGIVHTAWHVIMAMALLCFLPLCCNKKSGEKSNNDHDNESRDDSVTSSQTTCESR